MDSIPGQELHAVVVDWRRGGPQILKIETTSWRKHLSEFPFNERIKNWEGKSIKSYISFTKSQMCNM